MTPILPSAVISLPISLAVTPAAGGIDTGTVLLVLLCLTMVWLASAVSTLRNEIEALKEVLTAKPRPVPVSATAASAPASGASPAEVAAIAGAVHWMLGTGARIVAVVPSHDGAQAWSREGRREVFQSHQIR